MANADFQAIVEMEALAFHIGNMPLFAVQQKRREIDIQLIHPVFDDLARASGHRGSSLSHTVSDIVGKFNHLYFRYFPKGGLMWRK